jgi:hypothetical protein
MFDMPGGVISFRDVLGVAISGRVKGKGKDKAKARQISPLRCSR